MGRIRIKKKNAVLPFRETLAYRMILIAVFIVAFPIALYFFITSLFTNTTEAIVSGATGAAVAFGVFYNLDHLREAKIPKRTMERMRRR